jgi:hypothetical protein
VPIIPDFLYQQQAATNTDATTSFFSNTVFPLPINVERLQKVYDKKIRPPVPQITPTMLSTKQETAISDAITVAEADLQRNSNATERLLKWPTV